MLGTSKKYAGLLVAAMAAAFSTAMAAGGRAIGDDAPKPTRHKQARRAQRNAGAKGSKRHRTSTLHPMNGDRETRRRRHQIALGYLQVSK